jgi:hypothetical protein
MEHSRNACSVVMPHITTFCDVTWGEVGMKRGRKATPVHCCNSKIAVASECSIIVPAGKSSCKCMSEWSIHAHQHANINMLCCRLISTFYLLCSPTDLEASFFIRSMDERSGQLLSTAPNWSCLALLLLIMGHRAYSLACFMGKPWKYAGKSGSNIRSAGRLQKISSFWNMNS